MEIPPQSFLRMHVYVEEPVMYKFNCTLGSTSDVAVYGRKGLRPSHTKVGYFSGVNSRLFRQVVIRIYNGFRDYPPSFFARPRSTLWDLLSTKMIPYHTLNLLWIH